MKPIDRLMETVEWKELAPENGIGFDDDGLPWATHEGVLQIGELRLRCYRLNTGQAIFNAEDMDAFFDGMLSSNAELCDTP